jgi:acyl-CoA reductase-like NAD-dependent aldehyde dehydrogenase
VPIRSRSTLRPRHRRKQDWLEIFGPLLPIKTYTKIDEAIDYVGGRDRPLGLYLFTNER